MNKDAGRKTKPSATASVHAAADTGPRFLKTYVDTGTAARILNVCHRTIHNLLDAGRLRGFKLSGHLGRWRIDRASIDELIASGSAPHSPSPKKPRFHWR